jgi:hypothetical protein
VTTLVTEKNTAYYVIGTKDELVKQGAVAAEQHGAYGDIRISHTAPVSVPRYR